MHPFGSWHHLWWQMWHRILAFLVAFAGWVAWAIEPPGELIRGRLQIDPGERPVLVMAGGKRVELEADPDTLRVLSDPRLHATELGARGAWEGLGRFRIGPFHLESFWVYRNGACWKVSYWCPVCSIRTYTPGKCQCCQEETELDLQPLSGGCPGDGAGAQPRNAPSH